MWFVVDSDGHPIGYHWKHATESCTRCRSPSGERCDVITPRMSEHLLPR